MTAPWPRLHPPRRGDAARRLPMLAWWLRPGAGPGGPTRPETRRVQLSSRVDATLTFGPRPTGVVLVLPGLHYHGPADPRFDRFARVLAQGGALVVAPHLRDFERLVVGRGVLDDADAALDAVRRQVPGVRPGLFSVSFGSLPALHLIAERGRELSSAVMFGGFVDFIASLEFALAGLPGRPNDPLNSPVVVRNLLPWLGAEWGLEDDADRVAATEAIVRYCRLTWGRSQFKRGEGLEPVVREVCKSLAVRLHRLVRVACRIEPGVEELVRSVLPAARAQFAWADGRERARRAACPVTLVHGRDDDVIPVEQSVALANELPPGMGRLYLTGLYGHTERETSRRNALALVRDETRSLVGSLAAIAGLTRGSV